MKIHVILKKEDVNPVLLEDKVVVVLDILLATSTIVTLFGAGAKKVIPVRNGQEARKIGIQLEEIPLYTGEYQGKTIDGFLDSLPTTLIKQAYNQTIVLSTTNGTVAIRSCESARNVYIGSLLNGKALCLELVKQHKDTDIIIVCSGSSNQFCLEDFYGAGYLLALLEQANIPYVYSDAASAALLFYKAYRNEEVQIMESSRIGQILIEEGYEQELHWISQKDVYSIVPIFRDGQILLGPNSVMQTKNR
ncbi:MAG: 2-phosphosulfolactate phosphatase [Bacillaceae bacterium]